MKRVLHLYVRSQRFSVLGGIFRTDIEITGWNQTLELRVSDFMNELLPALDVLYSITSSSESAGE